MPLGVMIDSLSVFLGGVLGAVIGEKVPERLRVTLPMIMGLASMSMGVTSLGKIQNLPAVIFAVIFGTALGELIKFEKGIEWCADKTRSLMERILPDKTEATSRKEFLDSFVGLIVLFCASGTGIFGALQAGMTGNNTILFTKSILDLFTAIIFAASLGYVVALIFIPQFIILFGLFSAATAIMPFTTPGMLADFTACGGILMLATGARICGIKSFPIANMLPAMLIVMPLSLLWSVYCKF
jgi:uncharacterized membrane protein YqgA involved in biofilm formation